MGIMTDNIQQLERSLTSEQKKTAYRRQKRKEFELYLYNKFYNKFYKNKSNNPINIYSYFNIPEVKQNIFDYDGFLNIVEKNNIYNKILKQIYNEYKIYYQNEIKIKPEKEEEQEEENTQKKKAIDILEIFNYIAIGFLGSLFFEKHNKKYKF